MTYCSVVYVRLLDSIVVIDFIFIFNYHDYVP